MKPDTARPPAGGLSPADDLGQIVTINGARYRWGPKGLELQEAAPAGTVPDAEAEAKIAAMIGDSGANPAGNPYQVKP